MRISGPADVTAAVEMFRQFGGFGELFLQSSDQVGDVDSGDFADGGDVFCRAVNGINAWSEPGGQFAIPVVDPAVGRRDGQQMVVATDVIQWRSNDGVPPFSVPREMRVRVG